MLIVHVSMLIRAKLEKEYIELKQRVFVNYSAQFPKEKFTLDLFLWAFVMLFSRAARLSSKSSGRD